MNLHTRRAFLQHSALLAAVGGEATRWAEAADSFGKNRPLMQPVFDKVICPWTPQHPRHDHQLIFPLDDDRLLLVWSEYFSTAKNPQTKKGHTGAHDAVSCQISSMVSTDRGRSWGSRSVMQANEWKNNVKHPNLVRLSDDEILFSYVGWDGPASRNVYMRRSTDNGAT